MNLCKYAITSINMVWFNKVLYLYVSVLSFSVLYPSKYLI